MADAEWRAFFDLNFFTAVRVTRAALPALIARRGVIVNVSSIGARVPSNGPVAYNTAKAALTALGKALAEEFGPAGVRVVTVSPGPVRTAPPQPPPHPHDHCVDVPMGRKEQAHWYIDAQHLGQGGRL